MGVKELEHIRLILRGGSVVEWPRLFFQTREEVDQFLLLCQINTQSVEDVQWVRLILKGAVEYLRRTFSYRVSVAVAEPNHVQDLFLYASGIGPRKYRRIACIVLKVMHVIQHIEGRDLIFRVAASESDLSQLVTEKVMGIAVRMREKSYPFPIVEFTDSVKSRESVITKLLAKRETIAAKIYDLTRFRIVTRRIEDVVPVLYYLTEQLVPFNFVVPGQTENTLIRFKELVETYPNLSKVSDRLHLDLDFENRSAVAMSNSFSSHGYRMLNFVADVPLRLSPALASDSKGFIGFSMVEFQICDEKTDQANQEGDNSHINYKARQRKRVLHRLSKGLVVPRRRK